MTNASINKLLTQAYAAKHAGKLMEKLIMDSITQTEKKKALESGLLTAAERLQIGGIK